MLIQLCCILPSDGLLIGSIKTAQSYTDQSASEKSTARCFEVEFFCLVKSHLLFLLHQKFYLLSTWKSFCGLLCSFKHVLYILYGFPLWFLLCFLESLPLGFLVFNFHLGKITVINDVNESSYWAVRLGLIPGRNALTEACGTVSE